MSDTWTLCTWNVNSIKARLGHLTGYLERAQPDVVGLQELKGTDEAFPREAIAELGYRAEVYGQKTYNGVALLSREPLADVRHSLPELEGDSQARAIAGRFEDVTILDLYVPNGSEVGSDKYAYKLEWLAKLEDHLRAYHDPSRPLAVIGDFNVAPEARDIYDPIGFEEKVLFSEPERTALRRLLDWGLVDLFREFDDAEKAYSWWDYRGGAFRRNHGARIDLILVTEPLRARATGCVIDEDERKKDKPSDHVPVVATFRRARAE